MELWGMALKQPGDETGTAWDVAGTAWDVA